MRRASLSLIAFVILLSASRSLSAQCKDTDPSGRFDGWATSSQAGKLDISLNLLCDKGSYAGTLNTPIGVYVVTAGSFTGSNLKLGLSANGNSIALEGNATNTAITGTFSTTDDKGPVELHRVGNAVPLDRQAGLTTAQWHEDLHVLCNAAHQSPSRCLC